MRGTQTGFMDNLRVAVRENPLAAALIGGGALWLLMGNQKLKSAASAASAAAAPLRSAAPKLANSPPTAPDMDHRSSRQLNDNLSEAKNAVSDAVSDSAGAIKDRFDEGVAYARENLSNVGDALLRKETFEQIRLSLSDLLEKQPLVLGAIGLAVGAAVAGAVSTSDIENEWIGELSDSVKDDLNARTGAVSQSLREASDTLTAELGDTGVEAIDRVKQAGMDAADAAREKVKSP